MTASDQAPMDGGQAAARRDVPIPVNWRAAARMAGRLVPPGPSMTPHAAAAEVVALRDAAQKAVGPMLEASRLGALGQAARVGEVPARVVDRASWARAAAASMAAMTTRPGSEPADLFEIPVSVELAGTAEATAMLAFLSQRVLGQFDPFAPAGAGPAGSFYVVAPTVVAVRDSSRLPDDFGLWVCIHEMTHAGQFAAAAWLADYVRDRAQDLLSLPGRLGVVERISQGFAMVRAVGAAIMDRPGPSLAEVVLDDQQRTALDKVTAVMSLLEGHADVVMDEVGPRVIPHLAQLRTQFDGRRNSARGFMRVAGRLIGMEAKTEQYRSGAAFVRAVTGVVGFDGLNAVWHAEQYLPTLAELTDPPAWVRRVHG